MKRKFKLALIAALLIAVAAVSFGILREHEARRAEAGKQTADNASEQQADTETDVGDAGTDAGTGEDGTEAVPSATVFFASDYQPEEGFDEPSETLGKILTAARADGKTIDSAVMCGDYSNEGRLYDYQVSPDEAIEEIRTIVAEECPGIKDQSREEAAILFVQGNHDMMTSHITAAGLHEYEDHLVYVLNTEEDFPWKQGKTAGCLAKVKKSSADMKACFDELIERGETRPVFIAGHVPLHFTARTSSRHNTGDNLYASLIFDVVNEAAGSLDIVYLFGHDHSKGWDCYLGGSSVYKAKGDEILIPRFSEEMVNTDEYSREKLGFTYLNAGYSGYYMNCAPEEYDAGDPDRYSAADAALTGTVFEIYSDRIVATRYDAAGVHVLGHAGEADPYKGGIDAGLIDEEDYSDETNSPQIILRYGKL